MRVHSVEKIIFLGRKDVAVGVGVRGYLTKSADLNLEITALLTGKAKIKVF